MKINCKIFLLIIALIVFWPALSIAQDPPFYQEIQLLKKHDGANMPAPNSILLTGSSSFTKWKDVQRYFPGYRIINRAFGGSTIPDLIRYADEIIIPYKPKQVVIYCGDNDLASSDAVTPEIVRNRFLQLFDHIRYYLPKVHILYVSIKPSPSREKLMPKMVVANMLIEAYLKTAANTAFADVYHPMLLPSGKPDPSLFIEDNLHMNAKGYAIWQKVLKPYLLK